jgi:hypothetical protein
MRSYLSIGAGFVGIVLSATAGACALPLAEEPAAPPQIASPGPRSYACKDGVAALAQGGLIVGEARAPFARHDDAGDHYALARDGTTVEYIVPADAREDLVVRGGDGARESCTARGGHADVLARWIRGDSVDEIAASLGIGPDDVRGRLIASVRWARSRIAYDRVHADEPRPMAKASRRPPR